MSTPKGGLTIVATPIGNLGDLSPRAAQALEAAEQWIVEDTRVSGKLQAHLGFKRPMRVLNDHTGPEKVRQYADEISGGLLVALISDAGTPVVSDPGTDLVEACVERGVEVDAIPGPSAVTTALTLSGFYVQRFAFLGYAPRKPGPIAELLADYQDSAMTLVFFESPHRVGRLLDACSAALGARRYVICRELTKAHQQIWRATLPETPDEKQVPYKGEVTVVVEGRRKGLRV
ncbi:MAG TPA: 16S rRNA (cytidine(1402)-2'-O)-methyltransferase [Fimbriimonadaceae bacterium]|nr:16S rRNA (cytidine(1402)-2'-O)-methyltransferase [Fimbriimonadaceae bacterium]